MHHLIIGYGYCGFHLAKFLLSNNQSVTAVSRHLSESQHLPGLNHLAQDISTPLVWPHQNTIVYYLIPPPSTGVVDSTLKQFLQNCATINPVKLVYFGSSAVYGDKQGDWVDEKAACDVTLERQYRRLDAEQQCLTFAEQKDIGCIILRIAGIYGPNRLPIEAALKQYPLIEPEEAPFTNLIYIKDLAKISALLALQKNSRGIYNIADGLPKTMGYLQQQVANALDLPPAPFQSFDQVLTSASAMKREFMQSSKRLNINALQTTLKESLLVTPSTTAIIDSLNEEGLLL